MLGITKKYNQFKESTYFAGGKFIIYATCVCLAGTFAVGCLGLIIGFPLLTFPLAMLISHPVIWIIMGVVLTAAYKMVVEPLFHLAKNYINGKRASKGEKSEEKSPEREQPEENQGRPKTPDRDSGVVPDGTESPENRSRRNSNASLDSGLDMNSKIVTYNTAGAGNNCFFHSVFGQNNSGTYRAEKAQEMRLEWHKFLSRFESLDDLSMPAPLREQLEKVFNMFLNKPGDLTGKSDKIKGLAEQMNKKIEEADSKSEELKNKIVRKFYCHDIFRNTVYIIIKEAINQRNNRCPDNQKPIPSIQDLLNNKENLYNEIQEDMESCALVLILNLSNEEYANTYDPKVIKDSFINDKSVYKAYREAIRGSYCVFIEEIPILASLANIEIDVHYKNNNNDVHTAFKPNPAMINNDELNQVFDRESYRLNDELWGNKEQETIYLNPGHYERAKVVEAEPSLMEKANSALQGAAAACVNALGFNNP
ncbi:hypothetical protein [Wolbachia endosymbiont (group A) of Agelastica alni]|uniref:hypothetical protein n=1 Tax=Wolbachia endosymbiont (group A) of Agelastica alni TaxID=3066130 RepID=UPI003133301A